MSSSDSVSLSSLETQPKDEPRQPEEGLFVDIVGIKEPSTGQSCNIHLVCGCVIQHDTVARLHVEQVTVKGKEEMAIAAFWVTNGVEHCHIGFLPRFYVKHGRRFDGKLVQVVEMHPAKSPLFIHNKGACHARIIDMLWPNHDSNISKKQESDSGDGDTAKKAAKESG